MNQTQLKQILNELRVPDYYYSIDQKGPMDERWMLEKTNTGEWEVYFWERGQKSRDMLFENEEGACSYLLNQFIIIGGMKMNRDMFLPLGSIVKLKGGSRKMMIVARALQIQNVDQILYFDYGAVPYPVGVVSEQLAYFQQDTIECVLFVGYVDKEEVQAAENVKCFLAEHPDIKRGSIQNWK